MKRYLHHTGIIVPSEERVGDLMALMELEEWYRGYVPQWQALCIFTKPVQGSPIEFVVPDGGPLKKFNKGVGGVHHVALAVDSLDQVARRLADQGMRLLEDEHVKGAGPFLCNFLHPVYTRGVLIEFVQELSKESTPT
ncbi:MAG: VOC family protein [Alphaproteobacteria bacterium]|nr:VOC family protein [Alphaproteobacteria bacterium]